MEDILVPIIIVPVVVLGLPWLIFHYITKWKTATTLTNEDEALLDQMYETARRLEERLATVERIIAADNPDFRVSRMAASDDYTFDRSN